jgi:hypothetical protein
MLVMKLYIEEATLVLLKVRLSQRKRRLCERIDPRVEALSLEEGLPL